MYYAQTGRYDAGTGRDKEKYQKFHKSDSLNPYLYCENNPATYTDPRGTTLEDYYTTNSGQNDPVQVTISGDTITIDAYVDITGDVNYAVGNSTVHDLVIEGIEKWEGSYWVFGHSITVDVNVYEGHKPKWSWLPWVSSQNYVDIEFITGPGVAHTAISNPCDIKRSGDNYYVYGI